jgi:hypothetical protein
MWGCYGLTSVLVQYKSAESIGRTVVYRLWRK